MVKQRQKRNTYKGLEFDSLLERRFYIYLEQQKDVVCIERPEQVELVPAYTINGKKRQSIKYTPDFKVTYADGTERVFEIKAKPILIPRDFPLRQKLFEQKYKIELEVMLPWQGRFVTKGEYLANKRKVASPRNTKKRTDKD